MALLIKASLPYFLVFAISTFKKPFEQQNISCLWESEKKVKQLLKIDGRSKLIGLLIKWQFLIMILSYNLTISCLFEWAFLHAKLIILKTFFCKGSSIKYVSKIFWKTNISNSLIRTRTCAYQGVRNVSFAKNVAYVLYGCRLIRIRDLVNFCFDPILYLHNLNDNQK